MSPRRKAVPDADETPRKLPTTREGSEAHMVSLAVSLAEKQLREGTASAQVIAHFLKLGTKREELELERLRHENELTQARIKAQASQASVEEMYAKAIEAMKTYSSGHSDAD